MSRRIDDLGLNNLKIMQDDDFFCFGTDSVLLANFAMSNSSNNVILDLCSGSGVIPVIFEAKNKCKKIIAVELQKEMYELLEENVKMNNLEEKIVTLNEDINCFSTIRKCIEEKTGRNVVDIITVNPPYKEKGSGIKNDLDVKYIARYEEKCTLEDVFKISSKLLENKGKLFIVHKPERLTDLFSLSRKYNLEAKKLRFVQPKINDKPSIVLIEYVKGGGNELKVLKPLIEYNEDGSYTDEMNKIYNLKENLNE